MENLFGIDNNIIKQALKNGIKVNKMGQFIDIIGIVTLVYVPQMDKFMLTYGTSPADAGYVYVENYEKDWILR